MRTPALGLAMAALAALPAWSQDLPATAAEIGADCQQQLLTENNLTENDLRSLQADRSYMLYGHPVPIRAGGRASDLCTLRVADEVARMYDIAMVRLAAAQTTVDRAEKRAGDAEAALQSVENPYGLTWLPAIETIRWMRWAGELGWALVALLIPLTLWLMFLNTPMGRDYVRRQRARRDSRLRNRNARAIRHFDFRGS